MNFISDTRMYASWKRSSRSGKDECGASIDVQALLMIELVLGCTQRLCSHGVLAAAW